MTTTTNTGATGHGATNGELKGATEEKIVRGPYQNGIRRRREIIETATRVFATLGFNGGSLRQIAIEVGVTPAALTRHFDSKEGLLAAVLENWDNEAEARNPADVRGLDYFILLRDAVHYNTQHRGLIELFLTLSAEASNPSHPARSFVQKRYERVVETGVAHLTEAREAGDVLWMDDPTIGNEVRALYAMMDGVQLQWLIDPTLDVVSVFSDALARILERWTGRVDALPPMPEA
jgi:AcrR family transcriptional regulator